MPTPIFKTSSDLHMVVDLFLFNNFDTIFLPSVFTHHTPQPSNDENAVVLAVDNDKNKQKDRW